MRWGCGPHARGVVSCETVSGHEVEVAMRLLLSLGFAFALMLGAVGVAQAGAGACYSEKSPDLKNLCLAKAKRAGGCTQRGCGAEYCGKIVNRDIKKYCEATVQYRSKAMCGFIKDPTLKAKCKAEMK